MSKPGLFRALKEFIGEFRTFGNSELDSLKVQAKALQKQLDQVEAMRAARVKQEEALALMQVQSSVQSLQQLDRMKQKQEAMVSEAIEKASAEADTRIKAMLEHKAHEVVSNLDLSKALSMDIPPEQIAANALQEAQSELQVEAPELAQTIKEDRTPVEAAGQQVGSLPRDKG